MGARWDGPYIVVRRISGTYLLQTATGVQKFHVDYLRPWLNRKGNIKTVNLVRAAEWQRQQAVGMEILKVDDLGRVSPGKDCPELTRNKFLACLEMVPRRRLKWSPVLIKDEEFGSRKWTQGPAAGRWN